MFAGAKIGMERDGRADEIDIGIGTGVDSCGGDVLIPSVVGREGTEAVESCAGADCDAAASAHLRGGSRVEIDAGGVALAGAWIAESADDDTESGSAHCGDELLGTAGVHVGRNWRNRSWHVFQERC